jgi:hypothetical protein
LAPRCRQRCARPPPPCAVVLSCAELC